MMKIQMTIHVTLLGIATAGRAGLQSTGQVYRAVQETAVFRSQIFRSQILPHMITSKV